ncbi:unnamed protein product [Dicrocoelium dendriticum]|nr:unnamed protein product [Dicrocoelium dendriticum]
MGRYLSFFGGLVSGLLEYETQKVVQIHSKKVGITFRLIQLGIILYVVLWVMIHEKGYQSFDSAVSGVTAKLKGIAFANVSNDSAIGASVWDAAEYVIPPQQNSAFFVMTNLVSTPGQSLGRCEESHDVYGNSCANDTQCPTGTLVMVGSGVRTGRCVPSTRQAGLNVCEIYGWCPTEHDITPRPHLLATAENFTVILKNSIEFPRYRVKRRNILHWMDKLFLKTCRYNPFDDRMRYCPIFRLGDILKYSDAHNKDIWQNGGMVSIHIEWNCNLDFHVDTCLPKYTFRRLDDFESPVAKGWNFRFSQHYMVNGTRRRNLIKAYGIQFFITVYGTGGKFNVLTFSMNLGSGLALLGIATVLCDMIVLNATGKRNLYRKAKVDLIAQRKATKRLNKRLGEAERRRNDSSKPESEENRRKDSSTETKAIELKENAETRTVNCCPKRQSRFDKPRVQSTLVERIVSEPCWLDRTCGSKARKNETSDPNHFLTKQPCLIDIRLERARPRSQELPLSHDLWNKTKSELKAATSSPGVSSSPGGIFAKTVKDRYLPESISVPFVPPSIKY